jgi:phosphoribosylanthranilate isomerase
MTKIKICGLTNLADARAAAGAGVDYLGFIFYAGSKRAVTLEQVCAITAALRADGGAPLLIGVFVNATVKVMVETLRAASLDGAQLHGEEVPSLIGERASPLYGRAYKALRPATLAEAEAEAAWYRPPEWDGHLPSLMIDAYHPEQRGGTGMAGDWNLAAAVTRDAPGVMLAGGLNPENVARAVTSVRPFAVDVASGVEAAPGQKDPALMRRFVAAVRRTDESMIGHNAPPFAT